jgi:hypothetical protein
VAIYLVLQSNALLVIGLFALYMAIEDRFNAIQSFIKPCILLGEALINVPAHLAKERCELESSSFLNSSLFIDEYRCANCGDYWPVADKYDAASRAAAWKEALDHLKGTEVKQP